MRGSYWRSSLLIGDLCFLFIWKLLLFQRFGLGKFVVNWGFGPKLPSEDLFFEDHFCFVGLK